MSEIYKTIADGYEQLAAAFRSLASAENQQNRETGAAAEPVVVQESQPQKEITFDDMKDFLGVLSVNGKKEQVKALLMKYDSGKLSGVKKEDYRALLEDAKPLMAEVQAKLAEEEKKRVKQ